VKISKTDNHQPRFGRFGALEIIQEFDWSKMISVSHSRSGFDNFTQTARKTPKNKPNSSVASLRSDFSGNSWHCRCAESKGNRMMKSATP